MRVFNGFGLPGALRTIEHLMLECRGLVAYISPAANVEFYPFECLRTELRIA